MESLDEICRFFFCGIAGEADAEGTLDKGVGELHGVEDMAARTLFAGGAFGDVDAVCFKAVHQHFAFVAGQGDAEDIGRIAW